MRPSGVRGLGLTAVRRFGRVWSSLPASRCRLASEAVAWLLGATNADIDFRGRFKAMVYQALIG